jgi:hypothetical protein
MIPRNCDAAALPGQSNQCGTDPYILLADKAECVDQQTLKMQVRGDMLVLALLGQVPVAEGIVQQSWARGGGWTRIAGCFWQKRRLQLVPEHGGGSS